MLAAARRASGLVAPLAARRALPPLMRTSSAALCTKAPTLDTPFISDTIPLAEGILGHVEEMLCGVGQEVEENEVIAVVETDKVALDIRATRAGVIKEVLVQVGDEVKEQQPIYALEEG